MSGYFQTVGDPLVLEDRDRLLRSCVVNEFQDLTCRHQCEQGALRGCMLAIFVDLFIIMGHRCVARIYIALPVDDSVDRTLASGATASAIPEHQDFTYWGGLTAEDCVLRKKPLADLPDFGKIEGALHGSGDLRRRYPEARIAFRIKAKLGDELLSAPMQLCGGGRGFAGEHLLHQLVQDDAALRAARHGRRRHLARELRIVFAVEQGHGRGWPGDKVSARCWASWMIALLTAPNACRLCAGL